MEADHPFQVEDQTLEVDHSISEEDHQWGVGHQEEVGLLQEEAQRSPCSEEGEGQLGLPFVIYSLYLFFPSHFLSL